MARPERRSARELRLEQIAIWGDAAAFGEDTGRSTRRRSGARWDPAADSAMGRRRRSLFAPAAREHMLDVDAFEVHAARERASADRAAAPGSCRGGEGEGERERDAPLTFCKTASAVAFRRRGSLRENGRWSARPFGPADGPDMADAFPVPNDDDQSMSSASGGGAQLGPVIGDVDDAQTSVVRSADSPRPAGGRRRALQASSINTMRPAPPQRESRQQAKKAELLQAAGDDENSSPVPWSVVDAPRGRGAVPDREFRFSNAGVPQRRSDSNGAFNVGASARDWISFRRRRTSTHSSSSARPRSAKFPLRRSRKLEGAVAPAPGPRV